MLPRRKREASEMRERATKDDKREEPNEGWGGAVPGGTATRTGKRPTRATCVGVILVVRQKEGCALGAHVWKETDAGGVMWSVRPTGPVSSWVRRRVDCPHRQPRKNTLLHRMVVSTSSPMEFVASRGLTARLTSKGIGGQGRARRGGCAQPWCDEPHGRYGGWGQLQPWTANGHLSCTHVAPSVRFQL